MHVRRFFIHFHLDGGLSAAAADYALYFHNNSHRPMQMHAASTFYDGDPLYVIDCQKFLLSQ
jgi:hypothetical protein